MDNFAARYVPELDGLRGIAILAVVVHHQLTPFFLKGGFLGVDLFFVLSGFLITSLLAAEFDKTNRISLKNFYLRRVLRLGPALFAYLCGCLVVAAYTHSLGLSRQLRLIGLAIVYATNWRMAFGWDRALDATAIIWSLSIEEQFYLIWPIVFAGCAFLKVRRRSIASGLAVVIIAVLIHRFRLLTTSADLTRLYYGTDTRADALLTGCLVALVPPSVLSATTRRWFIALTVVAALLMTYLMLNIEFSSRFLYAGGLTFVAALAGLIIFVSAHSHSRILQLVLGFKPLRWIGQISYGLYLWHWLVVRNSSFYYAGKWEPWCRLALSITIASTSFYVLERPFNKLKKRFSPAVGAPRPSPQPAASLPPLVVPVTTPKSVVLGEPLATR